MAATTRRNLLATASTLPLAGLAAAAPAMAASHPDAALLDPDDTHDEARMMALIGVQSDILDEMDGLIATTLAGHRARATCLQKWFGIRANGDGHSLIEGPHVGALFRDLVGAGVA